MRNGSILNIKQLLSTFGKKSKVNRPAFYNQDWYFNEAFCKKGLGDKWYLVQKQVSNESRGIQPSSKHKSDFPSTILCAFLFFSWWLKTGEILWENDFVWCSDMDVYGDQIYVGKYRDLDDPKRSGFSIHRHLSIKNNC